MATKFGIEESKFEKYYNSPVIINETERDFRYAYTLGVQGFPSITVSYTHLDVYKRQLPHHKSVLYKLFLNN